MTYYKYDEHTIKAVDRFNSHYTKKASGCWEWNLYKDADGYGQFAPYQQHTAPAHRWILNYHTPQPSPEPVFEDDYDAELRERMEPAPELPPAPSPVLREQEHFNRPQP